ncbi:stage III sporulation protein [[Clostridium] ultunense Esp]|uniref:stage III sporulation protein AD n=1 Tax=Thermicanus aegyptius TaxID=94009 RepID=UPI0002B71022|nr:stage III sporulation protein AD [Thermicanus aegyptius]CCQ94464.1 stage III sporulation protein [[Clostridium] ultunense Esp]
MEIMQIVGLGIVATVLSLVVKEKRPDFAFMISALAGIAIFLYILGPIGKVITLLQRLAFDAHVNLIFLETVLKIIGIAYIAEFGAQITRDAGEGSIAAKIELGGKILILILSIPIIQSVIETILRLLPA